MAVFIYDQATGRLIDKDTGALMVEGDLPLATPRIWKDLPAYRSPIDGAVIEGRRARKYDLEKHGCIDANELSSGPKKLRNARFAKKHGVEHLLEQ